VHKVLPLPFQVITLRPRELQGFAPYAAGVSGGKKVLSAWDELEGVKQSAIAKHTEVRVLAESLRLETGMAVSEGIDLILQG
jgi:hypothetical protein